MSKAIKNANDTQAIISRYMSELGKKGGGKTATKFNGWTKEQISEHMKKVRSGTKLGVDNDTDL